MLCAYLVNDVRLGKDVHVESGGKEVHVSDVAKGIEILLNAPDAAITGQAFACYDQYVSHFTVAKIAKEVCGSKSQIDGEQKTPKHQIDTTKIEALGMEFGSDQLLHTTIEDLLKAAEVAN